MKSVIINKNDAGQRLDKFLSKFLTRLPTSLMYKYIRKKRIKVNNKRSDIKKILVENDKIDLYINDEFFKESAKKNDFLKAPTNLSIIFEDENLMLIDKKPGLIVHTDNENQIDCLINRVKNYLFQKGEYNFDSENSFAPALVNRIDRNTGGIIIAAKNAKTLKELNQKIKNGEIQKFYKCLVFGNMPKKEDILTAFLIKDEQRNKVDIFDKRVENSKIIKTKYKVIKEFKDFSLLEIELLTGRTHQIRAHLAHINHPIIGDGKYSDLHLERFKKLKYQALYSYKVALNFSKYGTYTVENVYFEKFI